MVMQIYSATNSYKEGLGDNMTKKIFLFLLPFFFLSCSFLEDEETDNTSSRLSKTSCDWLILSYFDADNNLNDELFYDMLKEEYALSTLSSSQSVKILALWDGESENDARSDGNSFIHPNGALYELGEASYEEALKIYRSKTFALSSATKDLTSYASDWLETEPNMADVETLTNFLSWAKNYYSATNVVLMLSDHGAGTEAEAVTGKVSSSSRSLCFDDTNGGSSRLTATDVKNAISSSSLDVNVIWQDCCLQGNAETAYILRGSADYLVTSANSSYSNDHYSIISSLADSSSTPLSFAKTIVEAYADELCNYYMTDTTSDCRASYDTVLTQVAYNLNSTLQSSLYSAIDSLSNALISDGEDVCNEVYEQYLEQDGSSLANCKGMAYLGSYVYLNDIGYFCYNLINDTSCGVSSTTKEAAQNVVTALSNVVESAWLGKKSGSSFYQYAKNVDGYSGLLDNLGTFGLTITTQLNPLTEKYGDKYYPFYSYYTEMTGYSSAWGELMKIWHKDELAY